MAKGPQTCPPGSQQIKYQEECKQAANSGFLGTGVTIATKGFSTNSPKIQSYCFVATNGWVHFNLNQFSRRDGLTRSICKRHKTTGPLFDPDNKDYEYFMVAHGPHTCPPGSQQIKFQEDCKKAANSGALGISTSIATSGFSTNSPKVQSYCFVSTNGRVHFNLNHNSKNDGLTRSVCKREKSRTGKIDTLTTMKNTTTIKTTTTSTGISTFLFAL